MRPVVDKSKCISCGACASICPEVFFMDDDGFAEVKHQDEEGNQTDFSLYEAQITEAIGGCPSQAIYNAEEGEAGAEGGEAIEETLVSEEEPEDSDIG